MNYQCRLCKLVRYRISQLIRDGGGEPLVHTADRDEYHDRLRDKLREEVAEFLAADDNAAPEELADVLEAVHALAADLGGRDRLEQLRAAKAAECGGFSDRVVWRGNR
ncbi:nucleoside triphosphate pyrophosphohydrolase [Streptomyces murinus]|uniref:nucleoside triphosphate pyrophosphohydrolase n=1 Tax=Streptomyces murinus TaxID=33900 RepID=UPI0033F54064